ncbi:MAG: hypothetical protein ACTH2Q_09290 [Propionibacteriaceae bacterium]
MIITGNVPGAAAESSTQLNEFSAKKHIEQNGGSLDGLRGGDRSGAPSVRSKTSVAQRNSGVPTDAFKLQAPMFGAEPNGPDGSTRFSIWGGWDYRDDYVNGSDPDDFATVQLKMPACYKIVETTTLTYRYNGTETDAGYLKEGGLESNAPIVGLRNLASDFMLSADNGVAGVVIEQPAKCKGEVGATFSYEHNQDGGNVAGISASWGAFTINYTGSTLTLQKSTNPVYFKV